MGLLSKAGEKFEETRQAFMDGRGGSYGCRSCGEAVTEDYEFCPHCGEDAVEPVDPDPASESDESNE